LRELLKNEDKKTGDLDQNEAKLRGKNSTKE
jgi:hypothetical protein